MKMNGSEKQIKWATDILREKNLTNEQIDNLLRYAGPTMYSQGIMYAPIIIDNRRNLAVYADSLGEFYKLSDKEKHEVAENAAAALRQRIAV